LEGMLPHHPVDGVKLKMGRGNF